MQQHRNLILFIVLSMAVLLAWTPIAQKLGLLPPPKPRAAAKDAMEDAKDAKEEKKPAAAKPGDEKKPADATAQVKASPADDVKKSDAANEAAAKPAETPLKQLPVFPHKTVTLGSLDVDSPYFMSVELTSQGASIDSIRLNDKRYQDLNKPGEQLKVVGNGTRPIGKDALALRTFDTTIEALDLELQKDGKKLRDVDWELVETRNDPDIPGVVESATFRYQSSDGGLVVLKNFLVRKSAKSDKAGLAEARETDSEPYKVQMRLEFQNKSKEKRTVGYLLQGPVGLPLENEISTRKFRDLKMAFLQNDGSLKTNYLTADALAGQVIKRDDNNAPDAVDVWKTPIKFLGTDVQYFAALVLPGGDQQQNPYTEAARPVLLDRAERENFFSRLRWFFLPWGHANSKCDLTVELESKQIELAPGGEPVVHTYDLFAGPKRQAILEPLQAESVLDFGFAAVVSKGMLKILRFFHNLGLPYGICIICLTILVRGCMFPLSMKQAAGAKRMKELQPKLAELKKKFGSDREKFARAQMELFQQNNYNPLSGCLPIFIQLPIFMGLYQALNSSVDLRMAPFLWFSNLAAPDHLFALPIQIPVIAQHVNLLPVITISLFVVQQKMFMPPPADEQQEMQYKMMNYMMVVMGAMFYHVPAGLCVYFIASSLWGMAERKLLDITSKKSGAATPPPEDSSGGKGSSGGGGPSKPAAPRGGKPGLAAGMWRKLLETADAAGSQTATKGLPDENPQGNGKKKDRKTQR